MVKKEDFEKDLSDKKLQADKHVDGVKDEGKVNVAPVDAEKLGEEIDRKKAGKGVVGGAADADTGKINVVPVDDVPATVPFWKKPWLWLLLALLLLGLLAWALGWFGGGSDKDKGAVGSSDATSETADLEDTSGSLASGSVDSSVKASKDAASASKDSADSASKASASASASASGSASETEVSGDAEAGANIPAAYTALKVGDEATIQNFASTFENGEAIPEGDKGKEYKVAEIKEVDHNPSKRAYRLDGVDQWVYEEDLDPQAQADVEAVTAERENLPLDQKQVGDYVTVQDFATHYEDRSEIPTDVLNKQYTIKEIKDTDIANSPKAYYLNGLNQWVISQDLR